LKPQRSAFIRGINTGNPIRFQLFFLLGQYSAPSPAKQLDMASTLFPKQIIHVFEKLYMASLIGGNGNSLYIFLNGAIDNFLHLSVMGKMDNFTAGGLYDPPHDIDGGIMSVKEGACRYNSYWVLRDMDFR